MDQLIITDSAAAHIRRIQQEKSNDQLFFRITVEGGGCSGYQYIFEFDDEKFDDDLSFEKNGVSVTTDPMSMDLLKNATIDYKESLMGSRFEVENPQADSACGCGSSFSIKIQD